MELEPGKYLLEVSAEGYKTQSRWVKLGSGEAKRLSLKLSPVMTPPPLPSEPAQVETPPPAEPAVTELPGSTPAAEPAPGRPKGAPEMPLPEPPPLTVAPGWFTRNPPLYLVAHSGRLSRGVRCGRSNWWPSSRPVVLRPRKHLYRHPPRPGCPATPGEESSLGSAEAYFNRGVDHQDNGQDDQAIADFSKAIELNPKAGKCICPKGFPLQRQRPARPSHC